MSHLHPGPISPPSKYRELHLSLIPSQSRSDLTRSHVSRICASPPYKHLDSCLQSINSMHHPNPGLFIFNSPSLTTVSFPSWPMYLHLISIFGTMCVPPASWLPITTIHVARIVSHLHHTPISPYSGLRLCVSTQSRSILTPSRSRHLCLISIQAPRFTSPLHPSWVSPQSRSLYFHLSYIQANQIAS